MLVIYQEPVL